MNPLRRIATRRLLAVIAATIALCGGIAAIAIAATTGGPVPAPKPLAAAIHDALAAPAVQGVSARIHLTDNLVDTSSLSEQAGSNPLISGADGRLWWSDTGRLRLELQSRRGDVQVLYDGQRLTVYDTTSNTLYRLPVPPGAGRGGGSASGDHGAPGISQIQAQLSKAEQHANLAGPTPTDVAGQPAYSVRLSPRQSGGLIGAAEVAWDAMHGVPLRFAVFARGSSSPVIELAASQISYGPVASSVFAISPPANAHVVDLSAMTGGTGGGSSQASPPVTGAGPVGKALSFPLAAPSTLAGRSLAEARLVQPHGQPAALLSYGQGLDTILVLEQRTSGTSGGGPGAGGQGIGQNGNPLGNLPTVGIDGARAQELATPLGTVLHFDRNGVTYTVLGSVPASTAEAAARGL